MSDHRPDFDRLTAYLEGALSIDGMMWVEQHLKQCESCRAAVDHERRFLGHMDQLTGIDPPPDFVEGVMARVAQYPAYRPAADVPWRRIASWGAGIAAALAVLLGIGAWQALASDALRSPGAAGLMYAAITGAVEQLGFLLGFAQQVVEPAWALAQALAMAVLQLFMFASTSGWVVQLGILLVTVTLNYVFTRMVLNYQRRRRLTAGEEVQADVRIEHG